jgi:hypothetical protein
MTRFSMIAEARSDCGAGGFAKSSRKRQTSVRNTNEIEMTDNHHGKI